MGYAAAEGAPYLLRLLTDLANFLHAYVDLNANEDSESYEFVSLFVCLLFLLLHMPF